MSSLPFELPPVAPDGPKPLWNGREFEIGARRDRVLAYDAGPSGWSDELTKLHEDETEGGSHFIDVASRRRALIHLERYGFRPEASILEIGVSGGHLLRDIRERFPAANVLGSDYTLGTLLELVPKMDGVPLIRMDLTKSPFPEAAVDAVVLLNVLEHIENDELAIEQCFRMLKPGGLMILEVPAGPHLFDQYDRELMHFRRYSLAELIRKTRAAGFQVLESSFIGFFLYPAFWLSKKWNRVSYGRSAKVRPSRVRNAIRLTAKANPFGSWLMRCEEGLSRHLSLPFGIRCVLVARKA